MGRQNRTETAKRHTETGSKILESANEKGAQTISEARELSRIAADMKRNAANSDMIDIVNMASIAAKESVQSFMKNEVASEIEKGKSELHKSSEITTEQLSYNEQIKSSLAEMDRISQFGREARESGKSQIESFSGQLREMSAQNQNLEQNAEASYRQQRQEIDSLSF